jgi:hypothetical protein
MSTVRVFLVIVVCLAVQAFAARPARADIIIIGPIPDFKGVVVTSSSATIESFFQKTVQINGQPAVLTGMDRRTFRIIRVTPIFVDSFITAPVPLSLGTDQLVLTDIFAFDLNPSGPPEDIRLTGFNPADPDIVPLSPEVFIGRSGQEFTADVNFTATLAELPALLPGFDLSAFTGDPNSIVYISQATVPASEFVTFVPEPSTLVLAAVGASALLGRVRGPSRRVAGVRRSAAPA